MEEDKDYFIGIFKYSSGDLEVEVVKEDSYTRAVEELHNKSDWDDDRYELIVIPRKLLYLAMGQLLPKLEDKDLNEQFDLYTTEFGRLTYPVGLVHAIFNQIGSKL